MLKLSKVLYSEYVDKYIGTTKKVLFESYNDGLMNGLTDNYIRVSVKLNKEYIGKIKNVKILNNNEVVIGEIVD